MISGLWSSVIYALEIEICACCLQMFTAQWLNLQLAGYAFTNTKKHLNITIFILTFSPHGEQNNVDSIGNKRQW